MDDFSIWSRPIPGQDPQSVAYDDYDERRDNGQRQRTALEYRHEIMLWLWGLNLFAEAYPAIGRRTYSSGAPTIKGVDNQHYWTRQSLVMLSGRSMKPALDLLLSCYYTEAWSLLRTALDGWARAVFVRLQPEEYIRWVETGEEDEKEATSTPKGPDWKVIEEAICNHGAESDRAAFNAALLRWRILHLGVHPSGTGITQTYDKERRIMIFRPEYDPDMVTVSLSLGVFVQRLLLGEIARLDSHSEDWNIGLAGFLDHTTSLIGCMKSALDAGAREIEAQRGRNAKNLPPWLRRRWIIEHPDSG